ncbi:MAG: type I methionyl aminopeptidase [Planctomycetes bacterium]|nr:type I methionyl aminopeptidase [Planctomycetota bacterium]
MAKTRPNEPCPCGSGKKYKKCCAKAPILKNKHFGYRKKDNIKNEKDIIGMRTACSFNAQLMRYIRPHIQAGISTEEINTLVHDYTLAHGHIPAPLNYHGFPKSVCTSLNHVVCHGIPCKEDILKNGDIINVDVTTIVDGYHGDQSETFYVGTDISDDAKLVTETSRRSLEIGIENVKPGRKLIDVCGAIEDFVLGEGCSVVRDFTGHGIGLKFHEEPQVPHYRTASIRNVVLQPGMTFTIEPMVNIGDWRIKILEDKWTAVTADGSLSAQFEHTLLVTEDGVEVLTATE